MTSPTPFQIDGKPLGGTADEPNPGPKQRVWHKSNIVEIKQIPGKGKRFVTVRTSDKSSQTTGTLWELELTIRSVTAARYEFLLKLIDDGGPFTILDPLHGQHEMYCIDGQSSKKEGDADPPIAEETNTILGMTEQEMGVADWVLKFVEAND